jgi:hypothetical protein
MQIQRVISTEHILSAELRRSEKLIWSGRPRQGVFLTQRDARMIPFSLFEITAVRGGGAQRAYFWGSPPD